MFNRQDICEAYFLFLKTRKRSHLTQICKLSKRFDKINFHPRSALSETSLSPNGLEIYRRLLSEEDYLNSIEED